MAYTFTIAQEALRRCFSVYVVIAEGDLGVKLYIGKTGDNREGCNPIISRCGNHFSYNKIHSQVRNKLEAHEDWRYTYVFDHFDTYPENADARKKCIDRINEMERWLNQKVQELALQFEGIEVLNPYKGTGHVTYNEQKRRRHFRTANAEAKLNGITKAVSEVLSRDR